MSPAEILSPVLAEQTLESFLRALIRSGLQRDVIGWFADDTGLVRPFSRDASDALEFNHREEECDLG